MNNWIKVVAVALPVVLGVGFWVGSDKPSPDEVITSVPSIPAEPSKPLDSVDEVLGGVVEREDDPLGVEAIPTSPAVPTEDPLVPLPSGLNQSDETVLLVMNELSPKMVQWLVPEEQVRKWVLAVDLLADGKLPQRHRPLAFSAQPFKVDDIVTAEKQLDAALESDRRFSLASSNDQRFSQLVGVLGQIDPRLVGRYYQAWLPMLEQAYGELGKPGLFQERMNKAVDNVLAVEPLQKEAVLKQPHVLYEYESPALEKYSAVDKAVWRLGTDNREALQAFVRELKFYL